MDGPALLAQHASERPADAWAELVRRHGAMVYAAALRQAGGDAHLAEDVTQAVFLLLGRDVAKICKRSEAGIAGWLYQATRFATRNVLRAARRRAWHERRSAAERREAITMHSEDAHWEEIAPLLDPANSVAALVETACKSMLEGSVAGRHRGAFLDFRVDNAVTRDPGNFADAVHYRNNVAREIEERIVATLRPAAERTAEVR